MTRPRGPENDWVSLSEASRLLGVSPATLRRWSDAGRIRVFTTPGGHRRFSREALQRLLPSDRAQRPTLAASGLTPARITRRYRLDTRADEPELPWVLTLSDEQRLTFREHGHRLASSLLLVLDASLPEHSARQLQEAAGIAAEYGRTAASTGLSLSQTVEGFLRFRAPFHHELALAARRRGFDAGQTSDLLETAERAMDRLLIATMAGHRLIGEARRHRAAPSRTSLADA